MKPTEILNFAAFQILAYLWLVMDISFAGILLGIVYWLCFILFVPFCFFYKNIKLDKKEDNFYEDLKRRPKYYIISLIIHICWIFVMFMKGHAVLPTLAIMNTLLSYGIIFQSCEQIKKGE